MSKKYIGQINNTNFVYPNNKLAEYDVEIIHELKENSVSGTTSGFDMSYSAGEISISFTYQWYLNSAEPFISNDGKLNILSVHMMTNDKKYFKPWICVGLIQDNNTALSYKTDTQNFVVTPQMVGQTSFTNGTYFVEVRMMGHRAVFPLNYSDTVSGIAPVTPTPTPTPTPTVTPGLSSTPTPTPTPTGTPPTLSYSNTRFFFGNTTGDCCIAVASAGYYIPNSIDPILGVPQYIFQNAGGTIPFSFSYVNDYVIGYPSATYNYNSSTGQVGSYVTSCL
jgi:hypothetical protein